MMNRRRGQNRTHDPRPFVAALLLMVLLSACSLVVTPTPAPSSSPAAQAFAATVAVTPAASTATPVAPTPAPTAAPTAEPAPGEGGDGREPDKQEMTTAAAAPEPSPTVTPPPTATPAPRPGLPVRLKIPAIKVDAAVEYVGLTADRAMDVPKGYDNTAWYQLGPRPGEPGNAVIAGHVDSKSSTAVFWFLRQLKSGDEIVVLGDDGIERKFVVTAAERYKRTEAPLVRIFGPASDVRLNLITCDNDGRFDTRRGEYEQNLVVYAESVR
jgi:LPXTG-site transpeptidase (sortase) family protein